MRFATILAVTITSSLIAQERPDISTVPADLEIPGLHNGPPAAGRRCKVATPGWEKTDVRNVLYLPSDWEKDKTYPVIVELAGNGNYRNALGDVSTGLAEGSKLGYGISGGKQFIWVGVPYLNDAGDKDVITWWGSPPTYKPDTTLDYLVKTVPHVCQTYGGDPKRVFLAGFSRGAIACNALGLANDDVAKLWCGMIPYSHYHGVNQGWPFPGARRDAALEHLKRLKGRPQFICGESKNVVDATKAFLDDAKIAGNFTFAETGFRNHNDAWVLRPSPTRTKLRAWVDQVLSAID